MSPGLSFGDELLYSRRKGQSAGFSGGGGAVDAIPAARLPYGGTWNGLVGVTDVDPTARTKSGSTLATSSTTTDIENALNAAGTDQYVELASGTFNLTTTLDIIKNNVTLRGQVDANGQPTTILNFSAGTLIHVNDDDFDYGSSGAFGGTDRVVSSGYSRGSSTVTLTAAPTGLTAGRLMWFSASANSDIDGDGGFTDWYPDTGNEPYTHCVKVTAVSGNDVTFTPPINADYVTGTINVHYKSSTAQIDYVGLENLKIINATGFFADNIIEIKGGNQCWLKNCWTVGVGNGNAPGLNVHCYFKLCFRCEMSHCQMNDSSAIGSSNYAISSVHATGLLIVNNYFHDLPNIYPLLSTSCSAFAYNFFIDEPYQVPNFLSQLVFFHGSHCHYNLFEGNWIPTHYNDQSNAGNFSHSRNTLYVRQRLPGWDATGAKDNNCQGITFEDHHDNATIAACVIGTTGKQADYEGVCNNTTDATGHIYYLNAVSKVTLLRYGNYNYVDNAIRAAEAADLASTGGTVKDSYLYPSRPSWYGSSSPFPWCDPANPTQSNNSDNLPAAYRAAHGVDPS